MRPVSIVAIAVPFLFAFILGASGAISSALGYEGWFGVGLGSNPPAPASALDSLESDLRLDEKQRERFNGFRRYCNSDLCECRNRLAAARARLGQAILKEPVDKAEIDSARTDLLLAYDDCQNEMIKRILSLKEGMDDGQKARLAEAFFPSAEGGCGKGRGQGCKGHRPCGGE